MADLTSETMVIDTVRPVISVTYDRNDPYTTATDSNGYSRQYYNGTRTATVTITEKNFNENGVELSVSAADVAGSGLDTGSLVSMSGWSGSGDTHTMTVTFSGEANYTFDVRCTDLAGNVSEDYSDDHFTVDRTAPSVTSVTYSASLAEIGGVSYYNAPVTVTVTARDDISGVNSFTFSASSSRLVNESEITFSDGGRTAVMTFTVPASAAEQFNGSVDLTAVDRAGNRYDQSESRQLVVDNIAPTAQVAFDKAYKTDETAAYYSGSIGGTVTITEANFFAEDVSIVARNADGQEQTLTPQWSDSGADVHTGRFTVTGDGSYTITVSYTDRSNNRMNSYSSGLVVLDNEIASPTFTINGKGKTGDNGGAYKDDVSVEFKFSDPNFDSYTAKLVRRELSKNADVTEKFVKVDMDNEGGTGSFDIPRSVENDGIYILTVTATDKSGNTAQSHVKFTVNRYGSVYEYDDYLMSIIKDGGRYIGIDGATGMAIAKDLLITEYNADGVVDGSVKILITRDGETIDAIYDVKYEKGSDSDGWYKYLYTISKDNFTQDGVYRITVYSQDETDNTSTSVPENSVDKNGNAVLDVMTFTVDTTPPEITNIANLEKDFVDANKLTVKYTVVDVGGLAEVKVLLDGKTVDTVTEFDNVNNYSGEFTIGESNSPQNVRLVATDLAGNVTDTSDEGFDPGELYVFNDTVTVSTNAFVRWSSDPGLMWGSIGGVAALAGISGVVIGKRRKNKKNKSEYSISK